MEQFRDWFIEYCDETWKEVPRGLKNQRYLGLIFDGIVEPFEVKYCEKLMTLPLTTLNKMNEWSLRQMGFDVPRIIKPLDHYGNQCLNKRIHFPHLHFYTKDEITSTIIAQIIRSFVWRFQWFIREKKRHRLYAYLSAKNKKAKLECLKRIFEWSYLSSKNPL